MVEVAAHRDAAVQVTADPSILLGVPAKPLTAAQIRMKPWWLPLCRHRYFGTPKMVGTPSMTRPVYQVAYDEWARYEAWSPWAAAGRPKPRPKNIWREVPQWAWTIRRERLAKDHADHTNPDPPPTFPIVPSKTVGRNGVYFYVAENASEVGGWAGIVRLCKQYNLWVALLVHELGRAPEPAFDTDAQRLRLQGEGITVVASGWVDSAYDLDSQAQAAAHWSQGFDEYMLNAEASFAYVPGQPIDGFQAMGALAPKLRAALGPKMPISLSCMWGQTTWLRPLLQAGLSAVRPQCYLNQYPHMSPAGAIERLAMAQGDLPGGLPKAVAAEATYGKYGGYMQPLSSWTAQDDAAKALGMKARSVWAAEFCGEADYAWIAR